MADQQTQRTLMKIPQFTGEQSRFQVWWMRFRAYAAMAKFVQAIGKTREANLPNNEDADLDLDDDAQKAQDDARKRNLHAMACYTMAFTTDSLMAMLYRARKAEWPSGIAANVTVALFSRYQPDDMLTSMEIKRALFGVKIRPTQSPRILFEKLQTVNNRFEGNISDADMLATAIGAAPAQYASTIAAEQIRRGDQLTLEQLETAMKMHWRLTGGDESGQETNEELALVDVECFLCHE